MSGRPGSRCHLHYVWAAVLAREGGEEGLVVGRVLVLLTRVLEAPMVLAARVPMVLAARVPMVLAMVLVSRVLLVWPHLPHRPIGQQTWIILVMFLFPGHPVYSVPEV